ncbi:MAG: Indolepyruvate oxidoreductase subunit IorA [Methanomassiliicoccales archaeon PtaB.Bin215]|nr:MAG: Indolepyruvate oxidoreductase subunit IorA [Methanomassiliicoccales archaeon PtaB.Bin215]
MSKIKRKIIKIDEEKCTGCGECVLSCAEGAIVIKDGKAKVVKDMYCDGLGACLGHCPEGALSIEEREADPFDEEAAKEHVEASRGNQLHTCHSSRPMMMMPETTSVAAGENPSQLRNWPIQLALAPEVTPAYRDASLLIAADCTGFSLGNVQRDFIAGRVAIIGCPKLDDVQTYVDKLTRIFRNNEIKDLTLIRMEVPCCGGLRRMVTEALRLSGKSIPLQEFIVERYGGKVVKVTS